MILGHRDQVNTQATRGSCQNSPAGTQWGSWSGESSNIKQLNGQNEDAVCVQQIKAAMGRYAAIATRGIDTTDPESTGAAEC